LTGKFFEERGREEDFEKLGVDPPIVAPSLV
jgi:hypothetical protein